MHENLASYKCNVGGWMTETIAAGVEHAELIEKRKYTIANVHTKTNINWVKYEGLKYVMRHEHVAS